MPSEAQWLTPELIIEFNELAVADTHEPHGLLNEAGLESALGWRAFMLDLAEGQGCGVKNDGYAPVIPDIDG